jgi:hypothetical protein
MRLRLVTSRAFYQGNLRTLLTCMCLQSVRLHGRAHRGTPQFSGRTVTLEHQPRATCIHPFSCSSSSSVIVTAKNSLITRIRKSSELVNSWLMLLTLSSCFMYLFYLLFWIAW